MAKHVMGRYHDATVPSPRKCDNAGKIPGSVFRVVGIRLDQGFISHGDRKESGRKAQHDTAAWRSRI